MTKGLLSTAVAAFMFTATPVLACDDHKPEPATDIEALAEAEQQYEYTGCRNRILKNARQFYYKAGKPSDAAMQAYVNKKLDILYGLNMCIGLRILWTEIKP